MNNEIIYYTNAPFLFSNDQNLKNIPGFENYRSFCKYYQSELGFYDRSGIIKFPFKTKNLNPIPTFDRDFSLTYNDCSQKRMKELDALHTSTGKPFRLLYSGGVDTSFIFSAFIEFYGVSKTREILEICCTKESIDENPWLWDTYIRKENFNITSAHNYPYCWNDNRIVLMGEGNDQLFGKTTYLQYKAGKNPNIPVSLNEFSEFLNWYKPGPGAEAAAKIIMKLYDSAPMPIHNMFMLHWWHEFVLTWDSIMYRCLAQANSLPKDILDSGLVQFFNTKEFQQWSMRYQYDYDPTSTQRPYKQVCKDIIVNVLNIPEYKNKGKYLSFARLHSLKPTAKIIDTDLTMHYKNQDYLRFIEPNNDFV